MIAALRIRGLGPHEDTRLTLDADGVTQLTGPSEAGKSTIADAIAFVLWGSGRDGKPFDVRAIRDGHREVRVDLTTGKGSILSRSLALDDKGERGPTTRTYTKRDGSSQTYATEDAWRAAIDYLGALADQLRVVLVPQAWQLLEQGPHKGKALRDLLNQVLPTTSGKAAIIAELMQQADPPQAFRKGDPVNEKDAAELARQRGIKVQEAAGAASALQAEHEQAEAMALPVGPTAAQVEHARDVVARAKAWSDGDRAREQHAAAVERRRATEAAITRWQCGLADLGEEPAPTRKRAEVDADIRRHEAAKIRAEQVRAESEKNTEPREIQPAKHLIDAANAAGRKAADARVALDETTDVCPCCDRPGWLGAKHAARLLVEETTAAKLAADKAVEDDIAARRTQELARAKGAAANAATKTEEIRVATEAIAALNAEMVAVVEAERWHQRRQALGPKPVAVDVVDLAPDPDVERPHSDEVDAAREVLDEHERAEGATAERTAALAALARRLDAARVQHEQHLEEHERLKVLLDAIRREPSVSVRRQLAVLGDLGPVRFELPESGGARVLVDGRPWMLASTGRLVVADVWLRAALRWALAKTHGAKVERFPLLIDGAQDVGGQELPTPAPAIVLTTTDDQGLAVASAERVDAAALAAVAREVLRG